MKKIHNTVYAPTPIGPYNQAIQVGKFLFLSGQIPVDPQTGTLINATVELETIQVMDNLSSVLKGAGFDFSHIVKTTIFLSDMAFFKEVNEIYGSYFTSDFPARETVAEKELPKGVNVEISAIAYGE